MTRIFYELRKVVAAARLLGTNDAYRPDFLRERDPHSSRERIKDSFEKDTFPADSGEDIRFEVTAEFNFFTSSLIHRCSDLLLGVIVSP